MFPLMSGTNYFAKKNIFLPHFEIVQNFHYFVRDPRLSIFRQKFNFPKSVSNVVEMFLLMNGTNNFAKKYFLTPFWDSTNFSLFCKVRTCRFSVKNSIFQKVSQMLQKCFFWWVEQIILPKKYFLTPFWDSTKFSLFWKGRTCRFSVKNLIFQKVSQML